MSGSDRNGSRRDGQEHEPPRSHDGWMQTPLPQRRRVERDGRSWFDRVSEPIDEERVEPSKGDWVTERSLSLLILTLGLIVVLVMGAAVILGR